MDQANIITEEMAPMARVLHPDDVFRLTATIVRDGAPIEAVVAFHPKDKDGRAVVVVNTQPYDGDLNAWRDVMHERRRQITVKGMTAQHDDAHATGEMTRGALNYLAAASATMLLGGKAFDAKPPLDGLGAIVAWPWSRDWWKPGLVRRMLVKAAALIIAEIQRLDRAEAGEAGR
jgi:hypothetical protein